MRPLLAIILAATTLLGVCSLRQDSVNEPPICVGGGTAQRVAAADDPLPAELRTPSRSTPIRLGDMAWLVAWLQAEYHISVDEATLRMLLQDESALLVEWLGARYPMSLGQVSLDHSLGVIVVATTDRAALTADVELNAYAHRDRVMLRDTRWSSRETEAAERCVWAYFGLTHLSEVAPFDPLVQPSFLLDRDTDRFVLSVADNEKGRAFLAERRIRELIDRSRGMITTETHVEYEEKG